MDEQKELSEELSEEELDYKALAARIKLIKLQNSDYREKETKTMDKKDYIELAVIIVICLCALVAGAFMAA